MSDTSNSTIGLIGLAVMGQNLALNIADHGFKISVYNRTFEKTSKFLDSNSRVTNLVGYKEVSDFVASLNRPRKIIIMVQAGRATDAVIDSLLPLIDEGDIIIDGGTPIGPVMANIINADEQAPVFAEASVTADAIAENSGARSVM